MIQEAVDVKCVGVLGWGLGAGEREVALEQAANILGPGVVDRDRVLAHAPIVVAPLRG